MTYKPGRRLRLWAIALLAAWLCLGSVCAPCLVLADAGPKRAASSEIQSRQARRPAVKVGGWLYDISSDRVVVGKQVLEMGSDSVARESVEEGDYVVATATVLDEGTLLAQSLMALPTASVGENRLPPIAALAAPAPSGGTTGYTFEFRGVLQEITPLYWVVGNRLVLISDRTPVQGRPEIGALAEVKGLVLYSGVVLAKTIRLTYPNAFVEVEFEGIIEKWSPEAWVVSGVEVCISAVTSVEGAPGQGQAAEVQGILQPDESVLAQHIRVKAPGFTARVELEGLVEEITAGYWIIAGKTVAVDSSTFVDESQAPAEVGQWAKVSALLRRDGSLLGLRIRVDRYR